MRKGYRKAVIQLEVPEWQIGQDVTVYFPDTMCVRGKCEAADGSDAVAECSPDRDKVVSAWRIFRDSNPYQVCDGREFRAIAEPEYCMGQMIEDTIALLKEQELPTELKQKMWNALYAEEDEYEKKFVGKEEHLNWFTVYRPWLQKGFDIAINAIADWEGR